MGEVIDMNMQYSAPDPQTLFLSRLFHAFDSDLLRAASKGQAHVFSARYKALLAALICP